MNPLGDTVTLSFGVSALHFSDSTQTEFFVKSNTCVFLLFCVLPFIEQKLLTNNINNNIRLRTYHCSCAADPRTASNHAFVVIYNINVDGSNCRPFCFCGMVQNLTEVIQDRNQNIFIFISLIIGLLNIYFSNLESQNRMTLGKRYVCFHLLVYSYSVSPSFYPLQKWHSP